NRKSGFFIGVTCPDCGAELELEEDFFVISCQYCNSVHRLVMPDIPLVYLIPAKIKKREARFSVDRYLKKKLLPLTSSKLQLKRLYYPYWKIDAVLLKIRNKVYKHIVLEAGEYNQEVSHEQERTEINLTPYTTTMTAGTHYEGIPATIGMRTEYIKLVPYAQETIRENFDCLPVLKSWEELRTQILRNVVSLGGIETADFGTNKTELFYPKASLVYFPYFMFESYRRGEFNRYIIDGVTGRFLNHITKLNVDENQLTEAPQFQFGALEIIGHRCSTCGIDLPAEQSYIYICSNCHAFHSLEKCSNNVNQIFVVDSSSKPNDKLFPFWSFKIPGDTARGLKNMFGGIYSSDRLVVPAFKMPNFNAMFRLAKRMSSVSPQLELIPLDKMNNRFLPVNISMSEAVMHAEIIIYRELYSKQFKSVRDKPKFMPEEISLFYAPFHPESYFYVDSIMNAVTFEKSLVY
ncbi:MAG: hypothetical protein ACE5D6_06675, partial [Candidatus Zixiibacteriota bacterium]